MFDLFASRRPANNTKTSRLNGRANESYRDEALFEELEVRQMMATDVGITAVGLTTAGPFAPLATVTASATFRNFDTAVSPAATIRLVLSSNNVYGDDDDIEILPNGVAGSDAVDPLNAGQILAGTSDPFALPAGAVPGSYYLIGHITTPGDTNAVNDTFVSATRVTIQVAAPAPDVSVTTTVTGGTFRPGQNIVGTVTARNTGAQATGAGFNVAYALSTDSIWGNADDIMVTSATGSTFAALNAAGVSAVTPLTFAIGDNVPNGTYRLLALADPEHAISESNESNNMFAVAAATIIVARPDLQGTITGPATVAAGNLISPTITIRNAGGVASNAANYTVSLRPVGAPDASTDIVILTSGNVSALAAGAAATGLTGTIAVPATVPAASYRLVLTLDTGDDNAEGNELNNVVIAAANTAVTNTGAATLPDVVASVLPITRTLVPGGTLEPFFVRVSNLGTAMAAPFHVNVFLSSNATLDANDVQIGGFDLGAVSGTVESMQDGLVPAWMPGGTYFLIVQADSDADIAESNEANNNGATATATITVVRPTVSITASDPTAAEVNAPGTPNPGVFTITRTGPTTSALVVNYTLGGTAFEGPDYTSLPNFVTIPVGATSATFTINVFNEDTGEPTETVIATLARGTGYSINLATNRATVNIADNEAVVTVVATDPTAAETTAPLAADGGRFTFTRTGPLTSSLLVTYLIGGTASGGDYTGVTGDVTFAAGSATAVVNIGVVNDVIGEPAETLIFTIIDGPGYGPGAAATATVTINDNEPVVTVTAVDAFATQTRDGEVLNPGQFRFTRTGPTTDPFTVFYTIGGTALNGVDYLDGDTDAALTGQVVIPAGQTGAVVNIAPQVIPRTGAMTVILTPTFAPAGPYRVANPAVPATVNITPLPPVNLTATAFTFDPGTLSLSAPGLSTAFSFTLNRTGLPASMAAFSTQIRLSSNNILGDADDIVLFTQAYAAGFTGSSTINGTLLWDTLPLALPGTYNLGLFVDSGNLVNEFNEVDNRLISASGQITFTP
ncbi:MAG: CARDB domain-containing protein [Phycisphaerales bacterium]